MEEKEFKKEQNVTMLGLRPAVTGGNLWYNYCRGTVIDYKEGRHDGIQGRSKKPLFVQEIH